MRPLLQEGPRPPAVGRIARARAFFATTWPGRVVAAALGLWLLDGLLSLAGWSLPAAIGTPVRVVLWLFAVWLAWRAFRWVSERLLWRIRTKLIVSYLFIALVPVVLLTLFMAVAVILLLGLTASRVVTGEIDRAADVLQATARSALAGLPAGDAEASRALALRLGAAREAHPSLAYTLLRKGRAAVSSGDAPRSLPRGGRARASRGWFGSIPRTGCPRRRCARSGPKEKRRSCWSSPRTRRSTPSSSGAPASTSSSRGR